MTLPDKKPLKVTSKCLLCDFEIVWEPEKNEAGFYQIPDGYCPNDYTILDQIIDGERT